MGTISRVSSGGYQANPSEPVPGFPQFSGRNVSISEDDKNVVKTNVKGIALQSIVSMKNI